MHEPERERERESSGKARFEGELKGKRGKMGSSVYGEAGGEWIWFGCSRDGDRSVARHGWREREAELQALILYGRKGDLGGYL